MDQAQPQSMTVDSAAKALENSEYIDSILGDEPEESKAETTEVEEAESEEVEGEEPAATEESEEAPEGESEEAEEEESTESEEKPIESLTDLAEALGLSEEDVLDKLKAKVKIDGEEVDVNLREALNGYQKDADYRRKTAELAEQRRTFDSQYEQAASQIEGQHHVAANLLNMVEKQVLGELEQLANDANLRQSDPTTWATNYAALTERKQGLQQAREAAAQAYTQQQQARQIKMQEQEQAQLIEAREALTKAIPDFGKVRPQLNQYLSSSVGFTEKELGAVKDHRLVLMAHKAMLYDQQTKGVTQALKKVKAAPKTLKPAKQVTKGPLRVKRDQIAKAQAQLRKSGKVKDAASVIENLI